MGVKGPVARQIAIFGWRVDCASARRTAIAGVWTFAVGGVIWVRCEERAAERS